MWFCVIDGQQQGPFSEGQFNGLIAEGKVALGTLVWKEGQAAWRPLSEVRSEFSIGDACEVCQRLVGADHLIELNGARVCAACKPDVLQKMREGVPVMPAIPRRRPVMVWVISIFYFVCTPLGVLSLLLTPILASSGIPIPEAQRHYLQSQGVFDYLLAGIGMVINLVGAILLFRLRRQALYYFASVFVLMPISIGYQIMFRHWLQVIDSQPGSMIGAIVGMVFSIGLNIALVWYVWHLKAKNVLR